MAIKGKPRDLVLESFPPFSKIIYVVILEKGIGRLGGFFFVTGFLATARKFEYRSFSRNYF